jgi:hypothetical protein
LNVYDGERGCALPPPPIPPPYCANKIVCEPMRGGGIVSAAAGVLSFVRHRVLGILVPFALVLASTSSALTPNDNRAFREGANHHLGDEGFIAAHGRAPGRQDGESVRMHDHLVYVHAWLAARPATKPELSMKRNELLGYLDDYIGKGTAPKNTRLPWRTPVFIDDDGSICAVGYLIERSSGRAVAESIAKAHRYDLLEDIATEMPSVRAWIEGSGFTLDELASIQPGYSSAINAYQPWSKDDRPADGAVDIVGTSGETHGKMAKGLMEGNWRVVDAEKHVVGSGELSGGNGSWHSTYANGSKLAEGPLAQNLPHGAWKFFHASGWLAAEGTFEHGRRSGAWRFYHDDAAHTPIAEGSFYHAESSDEMLDVAGIWRHYDGSGSLLATSRPMTPANWGGTAFLLDIKPGTDLVHHWVHEGAQDGDGGRLDMLYDGAESVYVHQRQPADRRYDANGNELVRVDGAWQTRDCHWDASRKRAAHAGDVVTLHGLIRKDRFDEERACAEGRPVAAARAKRLDALFASVDKVRSASPAFVRDLVLEGSTEQTPVADAADPEQLARIAREDAVRKDLAKVLADHMGWYVEWPHVDGRFIAVYRTLPGYTRRDT